MPPRRLRAANPEAPVTAYTLRAIPADIWKRARLRALREDLDMRSVLLKLLDQYVKRGLDK